MKKKFIRGGVQVGNIEIKHEKKKFFIGKKEKYTRIKWVQQWSNNEHS